MGFCLGVEQAVDLAKEVASKNKDKNIFILGELVHNKEVIKDLEKINKKQLMKKTSLMMSMFLKKKI